MKSPKAAAPVVTSQLSARRKLCLAIAAQLFAAAPALAGPTGGVVTGGQGQIDQAGATTTILQDSHRLSIDWQSFDIGADERVQFIQPGRDSVALNRIVGNDGTHIQGRLDANGQIVLVNPNGVFFGEGSQVNVGSLAASGLDVNPADFMNGDYALNAIDGAGGAVINRGIIQAATGGSVTLVGQRVDNQGLITAELGHITLAAGKQAVLTFDGDQMLGVRVDEAILQDELGVDPAVQNSGRIEAKGGRVLLTASASQDIFSKAVNAGDLDREASVVFHDDGSFTLGGGADVVNTGAVDVGGDAGGQIVVLGETITAGGTLSAAGATSAGQIELSAGDKLIASATLDASSETERGGDIKLTGQRVGVGSQARLDVSGASGGTVAVGGGRGGKIDTIRNSSRTAMDPNASIKANGHDGDAGSVIFWSDDATAVAGKISAAATGEQGDGGFIEVSSAGQLRYTGTADLSSANGERGRILFDPRDIFIEARDADTGSRDDSQLIDRLIEVADITDAGDVDFMISDAALSNALNTGDVIIQADRQIVVESDTRIQVADPATSTSSLIFESDDRFMMQNGAEILLGSGDLIVTAGAGEYVSGIPYNGDYGSILLGRAIIRTNGNVRLRATFDVTTSGGGPDIGGATGEIAGGIYVRAGNGVYFSGRGTDPAGPGWGAETIQIISNGGADLPVYELASGETYQAPELNPNAVLQDDSIDITPFQDAGIAILNGFQFKAENIVIASSNGDVSLDAVTLVGDTAIDSVGSAAIAGQFDQLTVAAQTVALTDQTSVSQNFTATTAELTQAAALSVGGTLAISSAGDELPVVILMNEGNQVGGIAGEYASLQLHTNGDIAIGDLAVTATAANQPSTITAESGTATIQGSNIELNGGASLSVAATTITATDLQLSGNGGELNLDASTLELTDITSTSADVAITGTFDSLTLSGDQTAAFSYNGNDTGTTLNILAGTTFSADATSQTIATGAGADDLTLSASAQFQIDTGEGDDTIALQGGSLGINLITGAGDDLIDATSVAVLAGVLNGGAGSDTLLLSGGSGEYNFQLEEIVGGEEQTDVADATIENVEDRQVIGGGGVSFFSGDGKFQWDFIDSDSFTITQHDEVQSVVRQDTFHGYSSLRSGEGEHTFDFSSSSDLHPGSVITDGLAQNTIIGPSWDAAFSTAAGGHIRLSAQDPAIASFIEFSAITRIVSGSAGGIFNGTSGTNGFTITADGSVDATTNASAGNAVRLENFTQFSLDPTSEASLRSSTGITSDVQWRIVGAGMVAPFGDDRGIRFEGVRHLRGSAQFDAEGSIELLTAHSVIGKDTENLWQISSGTETSQEDVILFSVIDGVQTQYAAIDIDPDGLEGWPSGDVRLIGGAEADIFDWINLTGSVSIYGSSGADEVIDVLRKSAAGDMQVVFLEDEYGTESVGVIDSQGKRVTFNEIETIFGKVEGAASASTSVTARSAGIARWLLAGGESEAQFYGLADSAMDTGVTLHGVNSIAGPDFGPNTFILDAPGVIAVDIEGGLGDDVIEYRNGQYTGTATLGEGDDSISFSHYSLVSAVGIIDLGSGRDTFRSTGERNDGTQYQNWTLNNWEVNYGEGFAVKGVEIFESGQDAFDITVLGSFDQISTGGGADTVTLQPGASIQYLGLGTGDDVVNVYFGATASQIVGERGTDILNLIGFEDGGEYVYGVQEEITLPGISYTGFDAFNGLPEFTSFFGGDGATNWTFFEDGSFEIAKLDEAGEVIQSDTFTNFLNIRAGAGANTLNLASTSYAAWAIQADTAGTNTLQGADIDTSWTLSGEGTGSLTAASGGATTTFTNIQTLIGGAATDSFDIAEGSTFASIDGGAGSDVFNIANGINVGIITGGSGDDLFTILGRQQNINLLGGDGADRFDAQAAIAIAGTLDGAAGDDVLLLGGGGGEYNFQLDETVGGEALTDTTETTMVSIEDEQRVGGGDTSFFSGDGSFKWLFQTDGSFTVEEYNTEGVLLRSGSFSDDDYVSLRSGTGTQDFDWSGADGYASLEVQTADEATNRVRGADIESFWKIQDDGSVIGGADSALAEGFTISQVDTIEFGTASDTLTGSESVSAWMIQEGNAVSALLTSGTALEALGVETLVSGVSAETILDLVSLGINHIAVDLPGAGEARFEIDGANTARVTSEAGAINLRIIDFPSLSDVGSSGVAAGERSFVFLEGGSIADLRLSGGGNSYVYGKHKSNLWRLDENQNWSAYEIIDGEEVKYAAFLDSEFAQIVGGDADDIFELHFRSAASLVGSADVETDYIDTIRNHTEWDVLVDISAAESNAGSILVGYDGVTPFSPASFSRIDLIEGRSPGINTSTGEVIVTTAANNRMNWSLSEVDTVLGNGVSVTGVTQLLGASATGNAFSLLLGETFEASITGGAGDDILELVTSSFTGAASSLAGAISLGGGDDTVNVIGPSLPSITAQIDMGTGADTFIIGAGTLNGGEAIAWSLSAGRATYQAPFEVVGVEDVLLRGENITVDVSGALGLMEFGSAGHAIVLREDAVVNHLWNPSSAADPGGVHLSVHAGARVAEVINASGASDTLEFIGFEDGGEFVYGQNGGQPGVPGIEYSGFEEVIGLPEFTSFFGGDGATNWTFFDDGSFEIAKLDEAGEVIQSDTFTNFLNIRAGAGANTLNLAGASYAAWAIQADTAGTNTLQGADIATNWTLSGEGAGSLTAASGGATTTFTNIQTLIGGAATDSFDIAEGSTFASIDGGAGSDVFNIANGINVGIITGGAGDDLFTVLGRQQNINLLGGEGADRFDAETAIAIAGTIDGGAGEDVLLLGGGGGEYNFQLDETIGGGTLTNIVGVTVVSIEEEQRVGEGGTSFFSGDGNFKWLLQNDGNFTIEEYSAEGGLVKSVSFSSDDYVVLRSGDGVQEFDWSGADSYASMEIQAAESATNRVYGANVETEWHVRSDGNLEFYARSSPESSVRVANAITVLGGSERDVIYGSGLESDWRLTPRNGVRFQSELLGLVTLSGVEEIHSGWNSGSSGMATPSIYFEGDDSASTEILWSIFGENAASVSDDAGMLEVSVYGFPVLRTSSGINIEKDNFKFTGEGSVLRLDTAGEDEVVGRDAPNLWRLIDSGTELYSYADDVPILYARIQGGADLTGGLDHDVFELSSLPFIRIDGGDAGQGMSNAIHYLLSDPLFIDLTSTYSGVLQPPGRSIDFGNVNSIRADGFSSGSEPLYVRSVGAATAEWLFRGAGNEVVLSGVNVAGVAEVTGSVNGNNIFRLESSGGDSSPVTIKINGGQFDDRLIMDGRALAAAADLGAGDDVLVFDSEIQDVAYGPIGLGEGNNSVDYSPRVLSTGSSSRWVVNDNSLMVNDLLVVNQVRSFSSEGASDDYFELSGGFDRVQLGGGNDEVVLQETASVTTVDLGANNDSATVHFGAIVEDYIGGGIGNDAIRLVGFDDLGEYQYGVSENPSIAVGIVYQSFESVDLSGSYSGFFGGDGATSWSFSDSGSFIISKLDDAGNIIQSDTFENQFINIRTGVGANVLNLSGNAYSEWNFSGDEAGDNRLFGADIDTSWQLSGAGNGSLSAGDGPVVSFTNMQSVIGGAGVDTFDLAADAAFREIAGGLGNDLFQLANGISVDLIDGGEGLDVLDLRDAGGTQNFLGLIDGGDAIYVPENIETINGDNPESLAGVDGYNVRWLVDESGVRVVGTDAAGAAFESELFAGKTRLLGASGDDAFELSAALELEIEGGAGSNSILARYLAADPLWALQARTGSFTQGDVEVAFADIQRVGALGAEEAYGATFNILDVDTTTRGLVGSLVVADGVSSAARQGVVNFAGLTAQYDFELANSGFEFDGISELVGNGGSFDFGGIGADSYTIAGAGMSATGAALPNAVSLAARGFGAYVLGAEDDVVVIETTTAAFSVDTGAGDDLLELRAAPSAGLALTGGEGIDTVSGESLTQADWTVSGAGVQLGGGAVIAGVEALAGSAGSDTVTVAADAVFGRIATGAGDDRVELTAGAELAEVDGGEGDDYVLLPDGEVVRDYLGRVLSNTGGGDYTPVNFETVDSRGSVTLAGGDGTNEWLITGEGELTLRKLDGTDAGEYSFSGITHLLGGAGEDSFTLAAGGTLAGGIDGGDAANTLTGHGGVSQWRVTGANSGTVAGEALELSFTNIANLIASGSTGETFVLAADAAVASITGSGTGVLQVQSGAAAAFELSATNALALGEAVPLQFTGINRLETGAGATRVSLLDAASEVATWLAAGANDSLNLALDGETHADLQAGDFAGLNVSGLEVVAGNGAGTLTGADSANQWQLSGAGAGEVTWGENALSFSGFNGIQGGAADDEFVVVAGAEFDLVDGAAGSDRIISTGGANEWSLAGSGGALNGLTFTNMEAAQGGADADRFTLAAASTSLAVDGAAGDDTLVGFDQDTTWTINSDNTGAITGLDQFASIENFIGGSAADTFNVADGARVGDLLGGAGNDVFNLGANVALNNLDAGAGDDRVVVGAGLQVAGRVDGGDHDNGDTINLEAYPEVTSEALARELLDFVVANFEVFEMVTTDEYRIGNGTNIWTITGAGSGQVEVLDGPDAGTYTFADMLALVGGTGNDTFIFAEGGSIERIEGGGGDDSLSAADLVNDWLINGSSSGSLNNSANSSGSLFTQIANLIGGGEADNFVVVDGGSFGTLDGGAGSDSLALDTDLAAGWNLGAQNSVAEVGSFSAIENLLGSRGDDTFTVNQLGHGVTSIDGRGGRDLLALAYEGSRLALGLNDVDGLAFSGIEAFAGAGASSALVGTDANSLWEIDGDNSGSVRYESENQQIAVAFADFGQLEGGAGDDTMQLAGGSVAAVSGGGGNDTLATDANGAALTVNGEGAGESDRFGRFTGFENIRGGGGDDRVLFNTGGLIAGDVDGGGGRDTFAHAGGGNVWRMEVAQLNGTTITRGQVAGASFTNFEALDGAGISDTLLGGDSDTSWFIAGSAEDSYLDLDNNTNLRVFFDGMESFAGGAGRDQFYFSGSAAIPSLIDGGGGGINTVNLSEVEGEVAVGISSATQVPAGGVRLANIERLTGNGATRLYGDGDQSYTWVIEGPREGRVQASEDGSGVFYYDNLGAIVGGAHDDVFQVLTRANLIALDGGGQLTADYVDYSQVVGDLSIELDTAFDGGIRGVEGIRGNSSGSGSLTNAELRGGDTGALWRIGALVDGQLADGINDGQVVTATGTINFIDFNMLTGGAGNDVFEQAGGAITGMIAGGGGDDRLSVQVSAIDALTQFDGGEGNDSLVLAGGGDGFSGRFTAGEGGGEFVYSTDTSAYNLQYLGVEQVDDRVLADDFSIIGSAAAERIALSNRGFSVGAGADVSLAGKLDLTVVGGADDTVVFTENVSLPGTLTVRNAGIEGGSGGLTASALRLEGTRQVGAASARLRTSINDLSVQNAVGDIWLEEQNGLTLGRYTSTGSFDLVMLAGDLASEGDIITTGAFSAALRAGDIVLDGANQLSGLVSLSGGEVELHNRAQLNLGPVTASHLTLVNERGINGEGPILVTEGTVIRAGGDVRLANPANDFNRVAIERAGDVHLVDRNAIVLNGIRADGQVLVEASPINVEAAIFAEAIDLRAGNQSAFINGELNTAGFGDVRISAENILLNAPIYAGGRTELLANANIAQNADIQAGGNVDAVAENGSVEVAAGVRTTSGANVSIRASEGLVVQDINAEAISLSGGSLVVSGGSLTATEGDIEVVAGSYTIGLNQVIRAGRGSIRIETGSNGDVALDGSLEAGGGVEVDAGGNITMGEAGSVAGGGDVSLDSGGDVALGSVTSGGGVTIDAGSGQVTDANGAGNNVSADKLKITAGKGVTGADGKPLDTAVGAVDIVTNSGDIAVSNSGDVLVERAQTGSGNVTMEGSDDINIEGGAIVAGGAGEGEGSVRVISSGGSIAQAPGKSGPAVRGQEVDLLAPGGAVNTDDNMWLDTPTARILAQSGVTPQNLNPAGNVMPIFTAGFKFDEHLLSVEPLEAINPAVFIDVRSYFYNDISLKMPRDQLYGDEDEL